jgi:hypothetical protein
MLIHNKFTEPRLKKEKPYETSILLPPDGHLDSAHLPHPLYCVQDTKQREEKTITQSSRTTSRRPHA